MKKITVLLVVAVVLAGCQTAELESLRQQNKELSATNASLATEVDELSKKMEVLEKENTRLKETDQYQFQLGVDAYAHGKFDEAKKAFIALIDRYPKSQLVTEAKKNLGNAENQIRRIERELKAQCDTIQKEVAKVTALEAVNLIEEFQTTKPDAPCVGSLATKKTELATKAAKEKKEKENLARLGVEISEIRTYWKIKSDVLGGQELAVPFIRFKLKNVGVSPIERLEASASFTLTDEKEVLGDGSVYVIGSVDAPLKPDYSREVFFGSSTGYTGMGIVFQQPKVDADLYLDLGRGKVLVKTFSIKQKLEGLGY
ncbi:MAG: hypothetical protein H6684_13235 [Deltaproteobacteria bacterium]|nr:hypothetical protein [Deltaproteobacteria bacterium]